MKYESCSNEFIGIKNYVQYAEWQSFPTPNPPKLVTMKICLDLEQYKGEISFSVHLPIVENM